MVFEKLPCCGVQVNPDQLELETNSQGSSIVADPVNDDEHKTCMYVLKNTFFASQKFWKTHERKSILKMLKADIFEKQ